LSALAAPGAAATPTGLTMPHTGYYPGATYLSTPNPAATPTVPSSSALTSPHSGLLPHKWINPIYPEWNAMQQLQYMFLPKLPRLKGERVNKSVKCDICNITLNSEVQAKQHYSGKNHLKKMKQMGMALPGEEEGKKVMEHYSSKSQDDNSEAQSSTSETTGTDEIANILPEETTSSQPNSQPNSRPTSPGNSEKASDDLQSDDSDCPDGPEDASESSLLGKHPRKRKLEIPCSVCDVVFNSEVQADQHFKGVRHAKRTKMAEDDKISDESMTLAAEGTHDEVRGQMEGHTDAPEVTWSAPEEGSNFKVEEDGRGQARERNCDNVQAAFEMQPQKAAWVKSTDVCDS